MSIKWYILLFTIFLPNTKKNIKIIIFFYKINILYVGTNNITKYKCSDLKQTHYVIKTFSLIKINPVKPIIFYFNAPNILFVVIVNDKNSKIITVANEMSSAQKFNITMYTIIMLEILV